MSAASYNNRLNKDCKTRLPYLDFHTGLAQNHSKLWVHPRYRSPGKTLALYYILALVIYMVRCFTYLKVRCAA